MIARVTGEHPDAQCACRRRQSEMNGWGWRGCWSERDRIMGWLCETARGRGHRIGVSPVWSLARAVLREVAKKFATGMQTP